MSRKEPLPPRGILNLVTANVVVLSIAAMALTTGILLSFAYRSHQSALSVTLGRSARYAADSTERFMAAQIEFLEGIVWIEARSLESDIEGRSLLDGILGYSQAILQASAVEESGKVLASASRRSIASAPAEALPFLKEAAKLASSGSPYLSPVYVDPGTAEPLITVGIAPFDRFSGTGPGIVACINLKYMREVVSDLDVGEGGRAYVVDRTGSLVAYADPSKVLVREDLSNLPPVAAALAGDGLGESGSLMSFRGIEGDAVVGTYVPMAYPRLAVVVELPWSAAYKDAIQVIVFGAGLAVAMAVVIALTGSALARSVSSPIQALARSVSGMADKGRLSPVASSGPLEIAELAGAFNAMADRLNRNEERLNRLLWNSNDIIAVAGPDGVLSYVSSSMERIFGYAPSETIGAPLASLLPPEDSLSVEEAFRALGQSPGAMARAEFRMAARDGRMTDVEMIGVNQTEDPVVRGMVLNLRDVSERKEAERERSALQDRLQHAMKMEAIGRLAGGVAHDINNILTGIFGSVQLADLALSDPSAVGAYLKEIDQWAQNAASLTRQLLAYSRKQHIQPRLVDLNALIRGMGSMLPRLLGEDIDVEFSLGEGLGPVKIDPGQIEQILVNLSANARDAMPSGGKLRISTRAIALDEAESRKHEGLAPGMHIRLTIEDEGGGMDKETQRRIFEPFFTTKSLGKGTGLGLATVYGAVRQSGGSIEVRSEIGKGSVFSVLLPMREGVAEIPSRSLEESKPSRGAGTLLLVEDRPEILEITSRMIKALGYSVIKSGGGDEALSALKDGERIDGMVTDVSMPGMSGIELGRRAREIRPGLKILFISGYADDIVAVEGSSEFLGNFLMKPYTLSALAEAIKKTLGA